MILEALSTVLMNLTYLILRVSHNGAFPPPLSAAKEREYFTRCMNGDRSARKVLIERNLRLVAHIVKKHYSAYKEQDDLISIGTIGLIKAIDSFNIENGTRFATYAGKCLQNEILMYFRAQKKLNNETSIDDSIDIDKDGNPLTYLDIIACEDTIAEELDLELRSRQALDAIKTQLTPREREIIILRYGLGLKRTLTQKEVADKLGISRSYVSRIEKYSLEKLHSYMQKPRYKL
ncbi:MAG: RNA polymerase sporulation sigma factor SigK [Eubacteriales bacterium]